jgi:Fe2+ transport system protein FeoA
MDDSKTKVCSIRYAPAVWDRVKKKAEELGVTPSRFVEVATRAYLGDPMGDQYKRVGDAFRTPLDDR